MLAGLLDVMASPELNKLMWSPRQLSGTQIGKFISHLETDHIIKRNTDTEIKLCEFCIFMFCFTLHQFIGFYVNCHLKLNITTTMLFAPPVSKKISMP